MAAKAEQDLEATVASDDFQSLEAKIYRTIEQLKSAREAKATAEADLARMRQQLATQRAESEALHRELVELRRERDEVRSRVEKMLESIDALTAG